jgi:aminopeptidase N
MLRTLMFDLQTRKDDRFTAMMRDFHESYRGRTASTQEFQQLVERHAGGPMGWFFDQWVRGMDLPTYRVAWKNEPADGGRYRIRLRVIQEHVPPDFRAPVLVSADVGNNRFANFRVDVHGGQTEYLSPLLPAEAKRITFNELHSVLGDVKMEGW